MQNSTSKLQKIINAHLYPEIQTIPIMTRQAVSIGCCQTAFITLKHTHKVSHEKRLTKKH